MNAQSYPVVPVSHGREFWASGLFWTWNVIFVAFMLFGFAPAILPRMIQSVNAGVTPAIYVVFCLVLTVIPVAAVISGALFLRKNPGRLFALGYVVEWPLLLILLFRFFLIREGNPAITVLLVWLALAEAVFLWHLFDRKIDERPVFWQSLRLAGLSLLFLGTLYAAAWLAFYVPPVAYFLGQIVTEFFRNFGEILRGVQGGQWYELPAVILGVILLVFSASLIVVMPVVAPILAGRAWLHSLRSSRILSGWPGALAGMLLPVALVLVILGVSMAQPQQQAFKLLETAPATLQQAQGLLQDEEQLRAGLVNAYLGPYRYISSVGEVRHISDLYQYTLNFSKPVAQSFEQAYEVVIRPLLYEPVHPPAADSMDNTVFTKESQEAAALYQRFFDQPISQGERQTVVDAVRSTYDGAQAEVAWQAVDDREVHMNRQEIDLSEHGDWAEVQIHEVYVNKTGQRQEVVYYFNLPESAVVTGLWLGNNPDRSKAFAYQVTPRGAAQALYRNELVINRDPALVEQIGPRQYRLRAFPVEARAWDEKLQQLVYGPELHLWLAYRTVAAADGTWPLPQLADKRNVYWDAQTVRLVNGKSVPAGSESAWLPAALPASQRSAPTAHRVDFPSGESVLVRPAADMKKVDLPAGLRLAVVLDRSFSMRQRRGDVIQALASLQQAAGSGPEPDLYLTSSSFRGEDPRRVHLTDFDPAQVTYFGGQNAAELLAQFERLQEGKEYDLIVVLTDASGYEQSDSKTALAVPEAPVWIVHLGGFPLGYDDPTLQAIQASGGGLAATVEEALVRYAAAREAPGRLDVVDGYTWQTLPTAEAGAVSAAAADESGFAALAARRVILSQMAQNRGKLDQLPILDQLNQLAVEQGIVTPYSSMLVLVNQRQQTLLDRLASADDRYQRESENVSDTAPASALAMTGVPEPEEWLLLALATLLVAYVLWKRRT